MTDETQLRTVSDAFLSRLARLEELEAEKRVLTPGTERMIDLSREIETMARDVLGVAVTQSDLAERAAEVPGLRPIEAVPPREPQAVLADWRAAERRLADAEADSAAEAGARADIERLKDEYRRAFMQRTRES